VVDYIRLEEYSKDKSVLFVDDDKNIVKESKEFLSLIFPIVDTALDGKKAMAKFDDFHNKNQKFYDLVITDIQMPNVDGIELTRYIYKKNKAQLLIVLSAHEESHYLLELVNIGISHFITKPLNYNSFVHVLYTKLKELDEKTNLAGKNIDNKILKINNELTWDKENNLLFQNENNIKLTKKEMLLLELLLRYNEKTHTVEEILDYLWKDKNEDCADISNLKNIISRLRKKVPTLDVENIYGFGYRVNLE
jgi:DNA-binding response OmpR family regulator